MSLFNNKTLAKHIKNPTIPEAHQDVIQNWINQIDSGTFKNLNEIQVQGAFTQQIMCKVLGYAEVGEGDTYTIAREYPIAKGRVDLALGSFTGEKDNSKNTVIAAFELKGAGTKNLDAIMSGRHKTPVQQAYEYAREIKGVKWVLLSNYVELRLYAISETSLVYEQFFIKDLLDPAEYARLYLLLSANNFLSGHTEELLKESNSVDKDISDKLYADYKLLRENMLSYMIADNPSKTPEDLIQPAQKLLDRILFISFAEDKGLIPTDSIKKAYEHQDPYNPRPNYQNFIGLFNSVDKGNATLNIPAYNGGLFAKDDELDNLIISDVLCEGFKDLAEYDFDSEVSVTILGHIFEQSIADLEILTESVAAGVLPKAKAKTNSVTGKRKKQGVVYTPDNITQFIVANTLGDYIDEQFELIFAEYGKYKSDGTIQWKRGSQVEQRFWYEWQARLMTIKVVDPAVGSGAFMVAAFDYLHIEYEKINEKLAELTGQRSMLDLNKEILNNNLFGVDINEESIEITKLSLWLKTAEKGKRLESLDANFIAGNSLGFDEPAPSNTFSWQTAFPQIFAEGGFDVVLGNPPYVRQELFSDIKPWLEKNYSVYNGVLDLYGYFFELGIKLLKAKGKMGYISSSTFFKTSSGKGLREYLTHNILINKIIDFGDLQIFEGVTTYPAIIIISNQMPTEDNKIEILPLRKSIPDNLGIFFDQGKGYMIQSQLLKGSWQLQDLRLFNLRNKLTHLSSGEAYPALKDVYGSTNRGILTGYNEAFIIDEKIKNKLIKEDPKSIGLIKPYLEGKDLKKWHIQPRSLYLITIPKYWTRKMMAVEGELSEEEAWEWLQKNYPSISEQLAPFTDKAKKRGDKGEFWWEFRSCTYYNDFEKPKIVYAHFQSEPLFSYESQSFYINNKCYISATGDWFLLGLLNSNCIWTLFTSMTTMVRGGFYEATSQNIEKLPIPEKPNDEKISSIAEDCQTTVEARYRIESSFARRLEDLVPEQGVFKLNNKLSSWWELDFVGLQAEIKKAFKGSISLTERNDWQDYFESEQTKRQQLQAKVTLLEDELNQEVYKLFNLTPDEIALIEAEVK